MVFVGHLDFSKDSKSLSVNFIRDNSSQNRKKNAHSSDYKSIHEENNEKIQKQCDVVKVYAACIYVSQKKVFCFLFIFLFNNSPLI